MEFHDVANIFPMMRDGELETLKADIAKNGLLEPIWLHPEDDSIIDGRNRYIACDQLGIDVAYRVWNGEGSLVSFVLSLNLHRRHLTSSQRAALAVEVERHFAKEAKERQGSREDIKQKIAECEKGQARDKAAEALGTNKQYVSDAKAISEYPDLLEEVKRGEKTIRDAKRDLKERKQQTVAEETPIPEEEISLIETMKRGESVVVNMSAHHHAISWAKRNGVYLPVDRTTEWGNPFLLDKDGTREDVCHNYSEHYLPHKPSLIKKIEALKERGSAYGLALGCHCAPRKCHAESIAWRLNNGR